MVNLIGSNGIFRLQLEATFIYLIKIHVLMRLI